MDEDGCNSSGVAALLAVVMNEDVVAMDYNTAMEAAVENADYQRLIARVRTRDWLASKCKEFIGLRPFYKIDYQ